MSRNRGSTECRCGLWSFYNTDGEVAPDDPSLLTQEQYWHPNFQKYAMGYGFREDLSGNYYHWVRRDAAGKATGWSNHPVDGSTRELAWTYAVPNPGDRYRWKHIQCPLCQRQYAGWYRQQPASLDPPVFELYDTSYFYGQNDEPADEDEDGLVEWTPQMLIEAAREYLAKRGRT